VDKILDPVIEVQKVGLGIGVQKVVLEIGVQKVVLVGKAPVVVGLVPGDHMGSLEVVENPVVVDQIVAGPVELLTGIVHLGQLELPATVGWPEPGILKSPEKNPKK
jgi:hypothetical protein